MIIGGDYKSGFLATSSCESELSRVEAGLFPVAAIILLAGVRNPFGGIPVLMSHSDSMGVAGCTLVLRGTWVLMRRISVPMWCLR